MIVLTMIISSFFIMIYVNIFWGIIELLLAAVVKYIGKIHLILYKDKLMQENHDNLEKIVKKSKK